MISSWPGEEEGKSAGGCWSLSRHLPNQNRWRIELHPLLSFSQGVQSGQGQHLKSCWSSLCSDFRQGLGQVQGKESSSLRPWRVKIQAWVLISEGPGPEVQGLITGRGGVEDDSSHCQSRTCLLSSALRSVSCEPHSNFKGSSSLFSFYRWGIRGLERLRKSARSHSQEAETSNLVQVWVQHFYLYLYSPLPVGKAPSLSGKAGSCRQHRRTPSSKMNSRPCPLGENLPVFTGLISTGLRGGQVHRGLASSKNR